MKASKNQSISSMKMAQYRKERRKYEEKKNENGGSMAWRGGV